MNTKLNIENLNKDKSIKAILSKLSSRIGEDAFVVCDHWEADLFAIGIARNTNLSRLMHISTHDSPAGVCDVCLEPSPDQHNGSSNEKWINNVSSIDELTAIFINHCYKKNV